MLDTSLGQALADATARLRSLEFLGTWSVALEGLRDESRLIRDTLGRQLQVLERGAGEVRSGLQRIIGLLGNPAAMRGDAPAHQGGWQRGESALPSSGVVGTMFRSLQFNGKVQELAARGGLSTEQSERDLARNVRQVANDSGLSSDDVLDLIRLMMNQGMDLKTSLAFLPDAATFSYGQGVPLERTAELTQRLHEVGGVTGAGDMRTQYASLAQRHDQGDGAVELLARRLSRQLYERDPSDAQGNREWVQQQQVEGARTEAGRWLRDDANARMGTRQGQSESLESAWQQFWRSVSDANQDTFRPLIGPTTQGLGQATLFVEENPGLTAGLTALSAVAGGLKVLSDVRGVYKDVTDIAGATRSWGGRVLGRGADIAASVGSTIRQGAGRAYQAVGSMAGAAWQRTVNWGSRVGTWAGNAVTGVRQGAGSRAAALGGVAKDAWQGVSRWTGAASQKAGAYLGTAWSAAGRGLGIAGEWLNSAMRSGVGRAVGRRALMAVGPSITAYKTYTGNGSAQDKAKGYGEAAGSLVGGLAGAEAGVLAGAAVGSLVPIVGTVAGALVGGMVGGAVGAWGGGEVGKSLGGGLHRMFSNDSDEGDSTSAMALDLGNAASRDTSFTDGSRPSPTASAPAAPLAPTSGTWTFSPQISINVAGNVSDPDQLANELLPRLRRLLADFSEDRQRDALFDPVVV
ncbi:hypothetical protein [Pseudomonas nitroreducens]|uniref:hypothetical protein n=1 Tax=Pseudomonas nitroreducens TaxID=46680 RepID=UPI00209E48EF|nr:hypothetical protein [Pseudomonas nitroreducens]MCP1622128.1 hypothetical protein [Pseudomonas nitroreducens]